MKAFGLLVILLCALMLPASAQDAPDICAQAKETVQAQITLAGEALAADRTGEASDLLRDARLLLIRDCGSTAVTFIRGNDNLGETAQITAPDVNPDGNVAYVRVANLSPDIGATSVIGLGGQFSVTGIGFGEFTGLIPIPAGSQTFGQLTWDFTPNSTWMLTVTGLGSTASVALQPIAVLRNDLKGQARVRIVQAVSGIGRVDVTSEEGVDFANGLGWLGNQDTMVEAGDYILRADTATGAPLITPTAFTFDANQSYLLFLGGSAESGEPALQFVTTINPQDTTRVRFVNAGENAVDVHYRPGNAKIAASLAGGETSDWVEIPTSSVTLIAYAPDQGPTGQELASLSLALRSGRDMTVTVDGGQMSVTDIAFTQ